MPNWHNSTSKHLALSTMIATNRPQLQAKSYANHYPTPSTQTMSYFNQTFILNPFPAHSPNHVPSHSLQNGRTAMNIAMYEFRTLSQNAVHYLT
jgi:hypothetical protein